MEKERGLTALSHLPWYYTAQCAKQSAQPSATDTNSASSAKVPDMSNLVSCLVSQQLDLATSLPYKTMMSFNRGCLLPMLI